MYAVPMPAILQSPPHFFQGRVREGGAQNENEYENEYDFMRLFILVFILNRVLFLGEGTAAPHATAV